MKIIERWHLLQWINPIFLIAVRIYQKRISPHKGFSCAHRKLHQQASCSEFFAINLQRDGITQAIPKQIERFQNCKDARRTLQAQKTQPLNQNLSQALSSQSQRKRQKKQNSIETCCDISCCDVFIWDCDFPDLDCDCSDIPCDLDCDCG